MVSYKALNTKEECRMKNEEWELVFLLVKSEK